MKRIGSRAKGIGMKRVLLSAALWVMGGGAAVHGQTGALAPANPEAVKTAVATLNAPGGVVQTGCSSCSSGLLGAPLPDLGAPGGTVDGCCGGSCYPGRRPCDCCCDSDNAFGRFFCGFYQCICCPDPCYEPRWVAAADTAFFQDAPRPITQMRLRYDEVWKYAFPDKAEFLVARTGGGGKGPRNAAASADYRDLSWYQEVAVDRFSASVEMKYQQISADGSFGTSGFGDMVIGTKSLLLDCELMQFSFGFKTFVPTGNFTKGLGTGHVALEPELLLAVKLAPKTYLQAELAYNFPLGGDNAFQGPLFHYHLAVNHVLWCCGHDVQLLGTLELNGYEFMGGSFAAPDGAGGVVVGSAKDIGDVLSIGPGLRLELCDKIDIGIGSAFKLTKDSVGDQILRTEFRWRF